MATLDSVEAPAPSTRELTVRGVVLFVAVVAGLSNWTRRSVGA